MTNKCPFCSAELTDSAEFCIYCMRQIKKKQIITNKPKSHRKLIIISVLSAVLVCGVLIFSLVNAAVNLLGSLDFNDNKENSSTLSSNASQNNDSSDNTPTIPSSPDDDTKPPEAEEPEPEPELESEPESEPEPEGSSSDSSSSKPGVTVDEEDENAGNEEKEENNFEPPKTPPTSDNEPEESQQIWAFKEVAGGIEITGIESEISSGIYEIPSEISGKPVVGIGDRAFYYESSIKNITLPETLEYISDQGFAGCSSLTTITIPSKVTTIGTNAFLPCAKLSDVYICSSNVIIHNYAFSSEYQRNVSLTIHAPASVMDSSYAKLFWGADYEEWNG